MSKKEFLKTYAKISNGAELSLPIVEINTQAAEFPVDKENYVNCSFKISNTENSKYDFERSMASSYDSNGGVGIRLRGNATLNYPKKPFRIKFNEKTSVLGMEKNKSWVLLADYSDKSRILNYAGFTLAGMFDSLEFTPTPNHVVLFVNDCYQGLYLLTEQIDANKGRVDIKESPENGEVPFLAELTIPVRAHEIDDVNMCVDIQSRTFAELKYPEAKDLDNELAFQDARDYVEKYLQAMWVSLSDGQAYFDGESMSFDELVDLDNLIDYFLVNKIMLNGDSMHRSTYIYKKVGEKAKFGPVWDFDGFDDDVESFGMLTYANAPVLTKLLLSNPEYYQKICNRYKEIESSIDLLIAKLNSYKNTIGFVAEIDLEFWYADAGLFEQSYEYILEKLGQRKAYLSRVFNLSHSEFMALLEQ